jgi:uncharacterized YccA/Bax inhibitor family protein
VASRKVLQVKSSNPVLSRSFSGKGFARMDSNGLQTQNLEDTYSAPSASPLQTGRMTMEDVVVKTASLFAVLLVVGAYAWNADLGGTALIIGLIGGFALSLVNTFSKKVRPGLVVAYAAFQGLFLGTITSFFETAYPGIASQAVLATLCAFGGMLFAYRSGRIRVTPKFQRVMFGAMIGYLGLALVSIIASFMGTPGGLYGVGGLGLILAAGGVVLASLFIVMDLDQIDRAIKSGVPQIESWRAAFGLMVTLVWLYLEMLRLISILRGND